MSKFTPLLAWILGALFIFAGAIKIIDPVAFYHDIGQYHLLPPALAWAVALLLPGMELLLGLALFIRRDRALAARGLVLLMLTFLAVLGISAIRGLDLDCGCFGNSFRLSDYRLIFLRDVLILAALIPLCRKGHPTQKP
jgi:putative oxidoreductase